MHGGKTATSTPSSPHAIPSRRTRRPAQSPPPSPVRRRSCRRPRRPTPAVSPTATPSSWEGVRALLKRAAAAAARSQHRRPWPTPAAGRPLFGGGGWSAVAGTRKRTRVGGSRHRKNEGNGHQQQQPGNKSKQSSCLHHKHGGQGNACQGELKTGSRDLPRINRPRMVRLTAASTCEEVERAVAAQRSPQTRQT